MLSFAATLEALSDARLYPLPEELKEEMGVVIGGGAGGLLETEEFYGDLLKKKGENAKFSKLSALFCASSADRIASTFGLAGPKSTFMTARSNRERPCVHHACRRCGTYVPNYLCRL